MHAFEPGLTLVIGAPRHPLGEPLIERLVAEGRPVGVLDDGGGSRVAPLGEVRILAGREASIDLGLAGGEYLALRNTVREIHHLLPLPSSRARGSDPLAAVRETLQLAESAESLERITYWSSIFASGRREGSLHEEPFPATSGAGRADGGPRAARLADALAAEATTRLPATLLRTGTIVLEPRATSSDEALGAARLLVLFLLSRRPDALSVMPGRADGVLSFVPAEHAVRAGLAIAGHERGARGIFHIVDPDPPSVRRAIAILCSLTGREAPRIYAPAFAASALLRMPGISPQLEELRALLDELGSRLAVSDVAARSILEPMGIVCPAFESYAEELVDEVRGRVQDARVLAGSYERRV